MKNYRAIVIGCSTGGLKALEMILYSLPENFSLPIAIVQHLAPDASGILADLLAQKAKIPVKEAIDKEPILPGTVYIAPPNYHLLIESGATISLSVDEKENYSRPSIDVLFESAADVYGATLVGVILTGSNVDGALGLKKIHDKGGLTIVQDPSTAEASEMPSSVLKKFKPNYVLPLKDIASLLNDINETRD